MQSVDYIGEFVPRWTFRSVLLAAGFTIAVYLMLPYLERLSSPPEPDLSIRNTDTIDLPPPPPPRVRRVEPEVVQQQTTVPEPQLERVPQRFEPPPANLNLDVAMDGVKGDFSMGFRVRAPDLAAQIQKLVFEIEELDEPPRPLARLRPMYPAQARMRKLEGFVVLEFIVNAEGKVTTVEVMSSQPGEVFTKAAVRAIERWRFSPGIRGGEAVAVRVRQKVNFNLN